MYSKEQILVDQIKRMLSSNDFSIGDRLPSERVLAEKFSASRNTVRGAIKTILLSGAVDVKRGSGYRLVSKNALDLISTAATAEDDKSRISEQLEAFFLYEPQAVVLATERMTEKEKRDLQNCVTSLSYAILENDADKIVKSHKLFHQIIAAGTANRSIRQMLERLDLTYTLVGDIMVKISSDERNRIFARHVNLLNAIKSGDKEMARKMSMQMILSTSLLLHSFEGVKLPEIVSSEIDDQIIDLKRKKLNNAGQN